MIFINNNAFSYVFVLVLCLLITAICSVCRFGCLLACLRAWSLVLRRNVLSISLFPIFSHTVCYCAVAEHSTNHASLALLMFSLMMAMCACVGMLLDVFAWNNIITEWNAHTARTDTREKECFSTSLFPAHHLDVNCTVSLKYLKFTNLNFSFALG